MNIGTRKSIMTGGKEILVETGKLAKQADGSVVVRMGDTMLLATVVAAKEAKEVPELCKDAISIASDFMASGELFAETRTVIF